MTTSKLRLTVTNKKSDTTNYNYRSASAGMHLPSGRYVAPGARVITQSAARELPLIHRKAYSQPPESNKSLRLVENISK